jgi:hypothetical protein
MKLYYTLLFVMTVFNLLSSVKQTFISDIDSILIRGLFKYSANYLETKKLLKLLKSKLKENLQNSDEKTSFKIKYDLMKYTSELPKLELHEGESIELNTDEVNFLVSLNNGQSFFLVASSDVNLENYYSEYLQTGLGRSAKQDFIQKTVEKITNLLN